MSEYDSDQDSLMIPDDNQEIDEEDQQIQNVRDAVRGWKERELDKNTDASTKPKGLAQLRTYATTSAKLFYALERYITSKIKDPLLTMNAEDIVKAIGDPETLSNHLRIVLKDLLERDLIELPFVIDPNVSKAYAEEGMVTQTEFPDEE